MQTNRMRDMRIRTGLLSALLLISMIFTAACSGSSVKNSDLGDYSSYLGEPAYNSSLTAMVYEDLDGEGEGIQYREVTDYDKLIAYAPVPVCLYFYSSLDSDKTGVTAAVEQMAEDYHDKILFVSVDAMRETDLVSHFGIEAVPDFVLLDNGSLQASFSSFDGKEWTHSDLKEWILKNSGIS